MGEPVDLIVRRADHADADAVAMLHADSWRRHYRGAYSDSFLDGDVERNRIEVWRQRLTRPVVEAATIVAVDDDGLIGFVHVVFDDDEQWGALIDNLHVRHAQQRSGVGRRLMGEAATAVLERPNPTGLYLWVLEINRNGQAFYEALGGRRGERGSVDPPGGDPTRLTGEPAKLRYVWEEPDVLRSAALGDVRGRLPR